MATEVFKVSSSALPDATRVAGFRVSEGISRLYQIDLYLLLGSEGQELDLSDTIGAKAKLELDRDDGRPPFVFHGIFAAFELLHEYGDRSLFHATVVPQLWNLTQTLHSRIFTNKTIPAILSEVLEDSGLGGDDYRLDLAGDYKPHEHVCQYGESNLDFIARWMEREGMYYYFEHGDEGEKLVVSDAKSFQKPLDDQPVRFFALSGHDHSSGEALHTFTCKHRALPASVKLKDYDYAKPTLDVSGTAPVSKVGIGEISMYTSRFFSPDDGKKIAKTRAEELLARQVVYRGTGTAFYLRSGNRFKLEDHPRAAFDQEYLAFEVEHVGNQSIGSADLRELTGIESEKVYTVEVKAIPASVQYRAESLTEWPRIYGVENGTVCGPAESEYAQIDDMGRYNVKFKFDESDLKDGKASTWVRMAQPHGGNPEGFHFPLRKGTEVIFTFLGGDPDRPVISGVVPNAHKPSPVTKSNHTHNILITGGKNRLEMEDKKDSEWVELFCPKEESYLFLGATGHRDHNFVLNTKQTGLIHTGNNLDVFVDGQLHEDVKKDVHQEYHQKKHTEITGAVTEEYADTVTQEYGKHHKIEVKSGGRKEEITGLFDQEVKTGYKQKVEAGYKQTIEGGFTQKISDHHDHTVEGPYKFEAKKVNWDIEGKVDIECAAWEVTQKDDVIWKSIGNFLHHKITNSNEFILGAKGEQIIGLKHEVLVGGKLELTVAAGIEIEAAAMVEITMGPRLELKGIHLENEGVKAKHAEAKIEQMETELKNCEALLWACATMVVA